MLLYNVPSLPVQNKSDKFVLLCNYYYQNLGVGQLGYHSLQSSKVKFSNIYIYICCICILSQSRLIARYIIDIIRNCDPSTHMLVIKLTGVIKTIVSSRNQSMEMNEYINITII